MEIRLRMSGLQPMRLRLDDCSSEKTGVLATNNSQDKTFALTAPRPRDTSRSSARRLHIPKFFTSRKTLERQPEHPGEAHHIVDSFRVLKQSISEVYKQKNPYLNKKADLFRVKLEQAEKFHRMQARLDTFLTKGTPAKTGILESAEILHKMQSTPLFSKNWAKEIKEVQRLRKVKHEQSEQTQVASHRSLFRGLSPVHSQAREPESVRESLAPVGQPEREIEAVFEQMHTIGSSGHLMPGASPHKASRVKGGINVSNKSLFDKELLPSMKPTKHFKTFSLRQQAAPKSNQTQSTQHPQLPRSSIFLPRPKKASQLRQSASAEKKMLTCPATSEASSAAKESNKL